MKQTKNIKLVVDNTCSIELRKAIKKQKGLINGKIALQNEMKECKAVLVQYENLIINLEKKIIQLKQRSTYVERNAKAIRNVRSDRNKAKD